MGIFQKIFGSVDPEEQKKDKFKVLDQMFLGDKEYANNAKATWLVSRGNHYGEKACLMKH